MGRGWIVAVVLAGGCGRLAFDGTHDGGAPGGEAAGGDATDAPGDTVDGPPGFVCIPGYRACDGFEQPTFASHWMPTANVTLDTTFAHRGVQSAKFHAPPSVPGADNYVQLIDLAVLPLADPVLYARAWVRLGALPLNNMGLMSASQIATNPQEVALFVLPDSLGVFTQFDNMSRHNNTLPPTNTWFCVVWKLVRDTGNTGSLSLTGDQPAASLSNITTDGTPALRELAFGVQFSGSSVAVAQGAFDIWLDDLIVSPTSVTCAD